VVRIHCEWVRTTYDYSNGQKIPSPPPKDRCRCLWCARRAGFSVARCRSTP